MQELCVVSPDRIAATLPYEWNSLEHYEQNRTRLLHYTDMPRQPWVCFTNPLRHFWYQMLQDALDAGFITQDELLREVSLGHVHPRVASWVGPRVPWFWRWRTFIPPYKRLQAQ